MKNKITYNFIDIKNIELILKKMVFVVKNVIF
jgi:hypothetical protein